MSGARSADYRADVDGLRAVAVIAVILFHAGGRLGGGFVGVDVFFVISGFLISGVILRELERGRFSVVDFYTRRIRRIFPALIVVLAAVLAIGWFLLLPGEYTRLAQRTMGGAAFLSNILEQRDSGYFGTEAPRRTLLHLWSLGVEEQFYLVWPLFIGVLWRRGRTSSGIVVALIASWGINVLQSRADADAAFFLPHTRLWELAAGALLASAGSTFAIPTAVRTGLSIGGVALITGAAVTFGSVTPYPGAWATVPVLGTVAVIAAGVQAPINRLLAWTPIVWIGLISYPLYLWHWPLLSFLSVSTNGAPTSGQVTGIVLLSVVLAAVTYWLVERPIRFSVPRLRPLAVALACAMVIVAAGAEWVAASDGAPGRLPPFVRGLDAVTYDYAAEYREGTCFLRPEQAAFDPGCATPAGKGPLLLLWGDSHAAHLYPGLRVVARERGFRVAELVASACPPIPDLSIANRSHCRMLNDDVVRAIREQRPDSVVLAARWFQYDDYDSVARTLAFLRELAVGRVIVVGPVPQWSDSPARLLFRAYNGRRIAGVPRRLPDGLRAPVRATDARLRAIVEAGGARYVSALDAFCNDSECEAWLTDGTASDVVAWDSSHLTNVASTRLVRLIDETIGLLPADAARVARQP